MSGRPKGVPNKARLSIDWLELAFSNVRTHAREGRWFEAWVAWMGVGQELLTRQRDAANDARRCSRCKRPFPVEQLGCEHCG